MSKIHNIFFFENSYGEFKTWLESRNPDEIIGKANSPTQCPLSTCTGLSIGNDVYHEKESYSVKCSLPLWASKFVQLIDDTEKKEITVRDALSILNKISV